MNLNEMSRWCEAVIEAARTGKADMNHDRAQIEALGTSQQPEPTSLNRLRDKAYRGAASKGFYDKGQPSVGDYCANLHGEVSELWEAFRKGLLHKPCDKAADLTCLEEELADILIRCFDMAGALDVDLDRAVAEKMRYNATRSYRHGGKVA